MDLSFALAYAGGCASVSFQPSTCPPIFVHIISLKWMSGGARTRSAQAAQRGRERGRERQRERERERDREPERERESAPESE